MTTASGTSADLERLAELLMSDASPENALDISALDGFIAAALAGPDRPHLSDVLPYMLDQDGTNREIRFESEGEAEELVSLIAQHWHDTEQTLASSPRDYAPLLYVQEHNVGDAAQGDEHSEISIIDDWCYGFIFGLQQQTDVFEQLPDELKDLLGPVFLFGTEEGAEELERMRLTREEHEAIADGLAGIVVALYQHFQGFNGGAVEGG